MKRMYLMILLCLHAAALFAQQVSGIVYDRTTKEPLIGATVRDSLGRGSSTNTKGFFTLKTNATHLFISAVGYENQRITADGKPLRIALQPAVTGLDEVVVSGSRSAEKKADVPMAISRLGAKQIRETRPSQFAELLNKVPGVVMTNLNNEQHMMSIRQPMTTSAYFLYMEDGIPIRPVGVFNHNALIEMNLFGVNSIEVIKGPASSIYGSEAIGGAVNFITPKPTSVPTASAGIQVDNQGYQRTQFQGGGYVSPKLGFYVSGLLSRQRDGWQTYSDYDKTALNLRADYSVGKAGKLIFSSAYANYDSQTGGTVDSAAFYARRYATNNSFTYRKVKAFRSRLTFEHPWNASDQLSATVFYRYNDYGQLPGYRIRQTQNPALAGGEINRSRFNSVGTLVQTQHHFGWLNSRLTGGIWADLSPNSYRANYIAINRDPQTGFFGSYTNRPDSLLTDYKANLLNTAAYAQYELEPVKNIRFVLGGRYDRIDFRFNNFLSPGSFSGAPDGRNSFTAFSPKAGFTWIFSERMSAYANYGSGFSPPTINQLYSGVQTPFLKPASFSNYEAGARGSFFDRLLSWDIAVYRMNGRNEIVSYRLPDNFTEYRNSGRTKHYGIEYEVTLHPGTQWAIRAGGTNAVHRYVDYAVSQSVNYNGRMMPSAPKFVLNAEAQYKPSWFPDFRIAAEYQRIGPYFLENDNRYTYNDRTLFGFRGVSAMNLRTGYTFKGVEAFLNVINATNELYANNGSRGSFGLSYTPAAPRTFVMGLQYTL
ncbi:MAG: TonB-dependent receptor [Mucilaginibacter polytrichastri]|nr:TonB-dependent receptor [Mucilaginibacter polytrichastri]